MEREPSEAERVIRLQSVANLLWKVVGLHGRFLDLVHL